MSLRLAAAMVAGLSLALAACGGDAEDGSTAAAPMTTTTETSPATTADDPPPQRARIRAHGGIAFFRTPDAVGCAISRVSARCDVLEPEWEAPPPDEPCSLDYGTAIAVGESGPGTYSCVGDTVIDPRSPVLEPGAFVELLGYRCENSEGTVTCVTAAGDHGFSVSRETAEVF